MREPTTVIVETINIAIAKNDPNASSTKTSAENIAAQLADGGVDAVVQEISTDDGKVLFRVRVTGLSTREDARQVGNDLESRYGINPVWVGQSPSSP